MSYASEYLASVAKDAPPAVVYINLYSRMFKHHFPNGYVDHDAFWSRVYNVLSPGERAMLLAHELMTEFHNGGFAQYFSNGNYEHAHETVRSLRRVGHDRVADYLQKAIQIAGIPDPLPPGYEYEDTEETYAALKKLQQENRPADPKQRPFYHFEDLLGKHVQEHPEEFS